MLRADDLEEDTDSLRRVFQGLADSRKGGGYAVYEKMAGVLIKAAQKGTAFGFKSVCQPLESMAVAGYKPSADYFETLDSLVEQKKSEISAGDRSKLLYNCALMEIAGVEVPRKLVKKWFSEANKEKKPYTANPEISNRLFLTSRVFSLAHKSESSLNAISFPRDKSTEQSRYYRALKKAINLRAKQIPGISMKLETEVANPLTRSRWDFCLTLTGTALNPKQKTVFWIQYDGPSHYRVVEGERDYNLATKLQNHVFEKFAQPHEKLRRIDYQEVEQKDIQSHCAELLEAMVETHLKRSLNRGGDQQIRR